MSRSIFNFIPIILLAILAGCGPARTRLTTVDNGKTVKVKAGDMVIVELEGNPSTGYTWEASDLDTGILQQSGDPEFKSSNPDLVGSGGSLSLTFKAVKAGSTTLTLVYHRPWEADVQPLDTFAVTVMVE